MNNKIKSIKAKNIFKQTQILNADKYRITLVKRPEKFVKNLGKKINNEEVFFTANDIQTKIKELTRYNMDNFDIYITPLSNIYWYLVIDDVTEEKLTQVRIEFTNPTILQKSSFNNFQCIYKFRKGSIDKETANKFVVFLNKKYGDPSFSGIEHAFRLASFANKKENKNNFFTKLIQINQEIDITKYINKFISNKQIKLANQPPKRMTILSDNKTSKDIEFAKKEFIRSKNKWEKLAEKRNWVIDESRLDYNAVKDLLSLNFDKNIVLNVLKQLQSSKHKNTDYAIRTVKNVESELIGKK